MSLKTAPKDMQQLYGQFPLFSLLPLKDIQFCHNPVHLVTTLVITGTDWPANQQHCFYTLQHNRPFHQSVYITNDVTWSPSLTSGAHPVILFLKPETAQLRKEKQGH